MGVSAFADPQELEIIKKIPTKENCIYERKEKLNGL